MNRSAAPVFAMGDFRHGRCAALGARVSLRYARRTARQVTNAIRAFLEFDNSMTGRSAREKRWLVYLVSTLLVASGSCGALHALVGPGRNFQLVVPYLITALSIPVWARLQSPSMPGWEVALNTF